MIRRRNPIRRADIYIYKYIYIILYYIILHYIILYYINIIYYIILYYIILHYIILYYIYVYMFLLFYMFCVSLLKLFGFLKAIPMTMKFKTPFNTIIL